MALFVYVRGSDLTVQERIDGIRDGSLQPWRTSADGDMWYKRSKLPLIFGIPKNDATMIQADEDLDDGEPVDDIEVRDINGAVVAHVPGVMHIPSGSVNFSAGDGGPL